MEQVITGEIQNYIFSNNDNNYRIFVVINHHLDRSTLCGYLPQLEEDLTYDFVVEEVNHPRYGKQYKVVSYSLHQDNSREGIITYLSSSLFPGVGLIAAEAIFDTLGPSCLDLIEKDPSVLDKVEKLSKKQKEIVYLKLIENRVIESIFIKLYQMGLSNKMVMTLYEKYGTKTISIIEENPYRLIYDVDGFGFKKTDELAHKLGFSYDDSERLKALLSFSIYNISNQYGLTFLYEDQLIDSAYRYGLLNTGFSKDILKPALKTLLKNKQLIQEEDRIYTPSIYNAEVGISNKLKNIMGLPLVKYSKSMLENSLEEFQRLNHIDFSSEQIEAIIKGLTNRVSIITGGPGTGKTTIVKAIVFLYAALHGYHPYGDEVENEVLLCAPTGKAAKRLAMSTELTAKTIHRALGYNFDEEFAFNSENTLPQHLIIVDETSMIDTVLLNHLLEAISVNASVVFVGDAFQLPSIAPGAVLKDLIESNAIPTTYLKTIYRQEEGSAIIRLSDMVKDGIVDEDIFSESNDLKYIPTTQNNLMNEMNKIIHKYVDLGYSLYEDIQVLAPMYKGATGIDSINQALSLEFNPDYSYSVKMKEMEFKEYDKVIQLTNSKELKIMNGDVGVIGCKGSIISEGKEKEIYYVNFDDLECKLVAKDFENLNLAYCISIHKSQGSEYPIVLLPMFKSYSIMLKRKLIYTAITRAKSKLFILGDMSAFTSGLSEIESQRQTSLSLRLAKKEEREVQVEVQSKYEAMPEGYPFEYFGEYDMEGITPYSFMENVEDKL